MQANHGAVHTHISIDVNPAAGMIPAAGDTGTDLVALATHGRSGLDRALLGSVADNVVRSFEVPVLMYCPQAANAAVTTPG